MRARTRHRWLPIVDVRSLGRAKMMGFAIRYASRFPTVVVRFGRLQSSVGAAERVSHDLLLGVLGR